VFFFLPDLTQDPVASLRHPFRLFDIGFSPAGCRALSSLLPPSFSSRGCYDPSSVFSSLRFLSLLQSLAVDSSQTARAVGGCQGFPAAGPLVNVLFAFVFLRDGGAPQHAPWPARMEIVGVEFSDR